MISVCLATYNGEQYIEEQLLSILSQISSDDEVIVSDDGSTDRTLEIIAEFGDSRITIKKNIFLHGYTNNFVNALKYANGDIIFFSDQDDVWLPDKYVIVNNYLKEYDLVVTNSKVTDENLNIVNESFFSIYNSGVGILKNIIICSTYYGSCMAIRRDILKYALPMPTTKHLDYDIWIGVVSEIVGKVKFIPIPLLLYRRSNSTATSLGSLLTRSKNSLSIKIYKRLVQLYYTFVFFITYHLRIKVTR